MSEILEDEHFVVDPACLVAARIEQKLKLQKDKFRRSSKPPTIHKIHENLRREWPQFYFPKLISIGPIHRESPELRDMIPLKWKYLDDLISRSPGTNSVKNYVDGLWDCEQEIRDQYAVEIDLDKREFVELLVLDGCFIVEFFIKRALGPVGSPWKEVKWNLTLLRNDLLLLENQVPFFVLNIIYSRSHIPFPNDVKLEFLDLALHYISKDKVNDLRDAEKIHHLLHLHHLCLLRYIEPRNYYDDDIIGIKCIVRKPISEKLAASFYFLVSLILMCKIPSRRGASWNSGLKDRAPRAIPCARNLKQAGVRFRRKDDSNCILNVSFTPDGTLEIPFLSIQQSSRAQYANLIAFEQCCSSAGNEFTTYAVFMDNIIDTAEDVAILQSYNIIESKLGTDEDVANLFNGICKGASLSYDKHYLVDVFRQVNRYCNSDRNRWRAQLVGGHFRNPWAVACVIAAIILLLVTITQTIFTVLSYWK